MAAATLLFPADAQAERFDISVRVPTWSPRAEKPWEYAVFVTKTGGARTSATVYVQVRVGGRVFDSLGARSTLLGIVAEPYTWPNRLRGRRDVVLRISVSAASGTRVFRHAVRVR